MRQEHGSARAIMSSAPTRVAAPCSAGHGPRRGRGRCARSDAVLTCPRHGPCFRCATGCASLISRRLAVPLVPCSTAGNKGNSYAGGQHQSEERGPPAMRRWDGRVHLLAITIAEFPFHPLSEQGGRETDTRADNAADRRPSRSGSTGRDAGTSRTLPISGAASPAARPVARAAGRRGAGGSRGAACPDRPARRPHPPTRIPSFPCCISTGLIRHRRGQRPHVLMGGSAASGYTAPALLLASVSRCAPKAIQWWRDRRGPNGPLGWMKRGASDLSETWRAGLATRAPCGCFVHRSPQGAAWVESLRCTRPEGFRVAER